MRKQDFDFLVNLLRQHAGWDFNEGQYFVVDKRISNFIREKGYASVEELVAELRLGAKPLVAQVVENLALSDTSFFRNYDVFQRFENTVLPNLRENNRAAKRLRIWSVGCSTGQEAYSIAMCIHRQFLGLKEWNINIVGSDISSTAISKAQRGLYNNFEIQTGLNAKDILNYFHKEDDMWSVNDELRRIYEVGLFSFFDYLGNAPVLVLGQFTRFDNSYLVALAALVVFVVRLEACGFGNGLFIKGVFALFHNGNNHSLIHFVGYYKTYSFFSERCSFHFCLLYAFNCLARITVFTLAMSFLTRFIARGFSS